MNGITHTAPSLRSGFVVGWTLAVAGAAVVTASLLPSAGLREGWVAVLGLILLAMVAGNKTIRFPALKVRATASDLYVFVALFALPAIAVPLVALAATSAAVLGPRRPRFSIRTVFNLFAVPLAAGVAAAVYHLMPSLDSSPFGPALVAVAVFHAVNCVTVSVAIRLETGRSLVSTLCAVGGWSSIACLASLFAAGGLYLALEGLGPIGLVPGLSVVLPFLSFLERSAEAS